MAFSISSGADPVAVSQSRGDAAPWRTRSSATAMAPGASLGTVYDPGRPAGLGSTGSRARASVAAPARARRGRAISAVHAAPHRVGVDLLVALVVGPVDLRGGDR